MKSLFLILLLIGWQPANAAIEVETDSLGGVCTPLVSRLRTRWMDIKNVMLPAGETLRNPKAEDFVCVSRRALQQATERRVVSGGNFRCFIPSFSRGLGVCCDSVQSYCARLNPGLFPDLLKRPGQEKPYEPPKSNWVRPPTDGDQWQAN